MQRPQARHCVAGNARPTPKRRPTGALQLRHTQTCHEAQYPEAREGSSHPTSPPSTLYPMRGPQCSWRLQCPACRRGASPDWPVPRARSRPATSTNEHCTRCGLHSSVLSANCMPLRGSRRPAGLPGTACHAKCPACRRGPPPDWPVPGHRRALQQALTTWDNIPHANRTCRTACRPSAAGSEGTRHTSRAESK